MDHTAASIFISDPINQTKQQEKNTVITKTCPCSMKQFQKVEKKKNFTCKNVTFFLIFVQNIDCGYTLDPPQRGGSNEYPQSRF